MSSILSGLHLLIETGGDRFNDFLIVKRNESDLIVEVDGQLAFLLQWLSNYFNFTYTFLQVDKNLALDEPSDNSDSLIGHLTKGECDLILAPVAPSSISRIEKLDFVHPFYFVEVSYIMPKPDSTGNLLALLQPFQLSAWICLFVTLPLVMVALWSLNWYIKNSNNGAASQTIGRLKNVPIYTIALLFARPGDSNNTKLIIRLVAGAWCIATFVLTNIYSNLLISYVTSPNPKPMLSPINDLANRPEIHVAVDTGYEYYIDPISDHATVIKLLLTRIASYVPNSICSTSEECLAKVKKGNYIFVSDISWLKFNVQMDFMNTKKCSFMIGKEANLLTIPSSFIIKKNSPYLGIFNLGTILFLERGLGYGYSIFNLHSGSNDAISYCQKRYNNDSSSELKGLSLKNLTPAFVVLAIGYLLALLAFLVEKIGFHAHSKLRHFFFNRRTVFKLFKN